MIRPLVLAFALSLPTLAQGVPIPVPDRRDHVYDAGRRILYVSTAHGSIERWDAVGERLLAPLAVGNDLNGLDLTVDGRFLYVAESEAVGDQGLLRKVDLESGDVATLTFHLDDQPFEDGAWDIVIGSAGRALIVTHPCQFCSGGAFLRELVLATGSISRRLDVQFGRITDRASLARGRDRSRILIVENNSSAGPVFTYDCAANTFSSKRNLNTFVLGGNSVSRDGSLLAVGEGYDTRVLDAALNPVQTLTNAWGGAIFDSQRALFYVVDAPSDQIVVRETNGFTEVGRIDVAEDLLGFGPLHDGEMSIGPAGDFLFLSTPVGLREFIVGPVAPAVLSSAADRLPHDAPPVPVTLHGRFFALGTGTRVFFGASEASAVQVVDDATLVATPPPGVPGPVDVRVTNSAGEGVLRDGFVYTPGVRVRGLAELGQRLWIDYLATPGGGIVASYGLGPAVSRPTRYGILCIEPAYRLFRLAPSSLPSFTLAVDVPPTPSLIGATLLLQALVGTSPSQAHFTNCAAITIH